MTTSSLELCCELVTRQSISPSDEGCQDILISHLESLGFTIEKMPFGDVSNFWARLGKNSPVVCFAGHTDVVPPGNEEHWNSPPFTPDIRNGKLYGRGTADMKASLAAMISATQNFLASSPTPSGSIAFLITSDEESIAVDGTRKVMETLNARGETIDYCVVGEPSSTTKTGDIIKNGRRGSLNGTLVIKGQQGHVAYPHLATNPVHAFMPALAELCAHQWDQGNAHFPPTSFQISNIKAGTGATNVIPGEMEVLFNFRYSTEVTHQQLQEITESIFNRHYIDYQLDWQLSGEPFITEQGKLTDAVLAAIEDTTGIKAKLSTSGGTSDGRFIAPSGTQVVELGPCNASIHKVDEHIELDDLPTLSAIYQRILEKLLS